MPESVSTVIPTYNSAHFVVEAVESALSQTRPSLEIIVVDDGSQDDTRERLEPYLDRIRYVYQENRGPSAARNTGIRAASGDWIALLDADDLWHPEKTEVQFEAAGRMGEFDLIGSHGSQPPLPERLPRDPVVRRRGVRDLLLSTPMFPSGTLIRRRCFDQVGFFDEALRGAEDRDMWLRIAVYCEVASVRSPCVVYRSHAGQTSHQAECMLRNHRAMLDKFFREHPQPVSTRRASWATMYRAGALTYLEGGDRKRAVALLLSSLWAWPMPLPESKRRLAPLLKLGLMIGLGDAWTARVKRAFRDDPASRT